MSENNSKEKEILEAAKNRFAHYGFSKVTMEEIASDVEMGKASLYYYFPTKEDLFRSVISEEINELQKNIELILQKPDSASQKLQSYVEQRMIFFQKLINLGTLSVHSYFDTKSMFKKIFLDFGEVEHALIKKIIEEGKESNEFDNEICDETAEVFLHILQGLRCNVLRWSKGQGVDEKTRENLQKEMSIAAEIFIQGIKKRK
jgi:TetR/AcrR family transcriptional regulator